VKSYQVSGPDWMSSARFDLSAKVPAGATKAQSNVMLQNLLADRFKLVLHHSTKESSIYALLVAKGGPKLPENKADQFSASSVRENLPRIVEGGFLFTNTSITEFAEQLSQLRPIGQPVLDRTGIKGVYDITLKSAANAILQADGPTLFTLIEEQLG